MKKALALLLVILSLLCSCSKKENVSSDTEKSSITSSSTKESSITTSSKAISAVKNNLAGTMFSTDQRIASALGFKNFYSPTYGTSNATQNSDGSWDVEINGKMTGYTDDYASDMEVYKFKIKATVDESGNVSMSVSKVY